jgi:hypothetical protein
VLDQDVGYSATARRFGVSAGRIRQKHKEYHSVLGISRVADKRCYGRDSPKRSTTCQLPLSRDQLTVVFSEDVACGSALGLWRDEWGNAPQGFVGVEMIAGYWRGFQNSAGDIVPALMAMVSVVGCHERRRDPDLAQRWLCSFLWRR